MTRYYNYLYIYNIIYYRMNEWMDYLKYNLNRFHEIHPYILFRKKAEYWKNKEKRERKRRRENYGQWLRCLSIGLFALSRCPVVNQTKHFVQRLRLNLRKHRDVTLHSSIITAHQQSRTSVQAKDCATCNYTGFSLCCRAFFQPLIISLFDDECSKKGL